MHVEWKGERCVLCLDDATLTKEHIIPASLGGMLTCTFLCKPCNSKLGETLEAAAKTDPSIRVAVGHLEGAIPDLARRLTEGQDFASYGPGGHGRGTVRKGQFQSRARTEADGSLTHSTEHGRKSIATMLRRAGVEEAPIQTALKRFDEAPENEKVPIGAGLEAVKWTIERIEPDLSRSVLLTPLVPLKIAYEFVACHLGTAIYDDAPQMAQIRQVLREAIEDHPCYAVERLNASEYKPFHGLVFAGNDPYAKVLIRLFGWLAFRVHLKHLAVGGHRFVYTHFLDSNQEDVRIVDCQEAAS